MASRLDRLFVLLESGSSSVTRKAAAQQLGEVQRMQPHELHHLLAKVYCHLKSSAWETRIAAGQAIEAILKNVPQWDPTPCENDNKETEMFESGRLRFETFDIEKVLAQGAHLMGSEGKEYDIEEDSHSGIDMREKLARQRQVLNARLGLDMVSKLGMDMTDLFSNEDLMSDMVTPVTPTTPSNASNSPPKLEYRLYLRPISELLPRGVQLSSREINRARRKARQLKSTSMDDPSVTPNSNISMEPEKKKLKFDPAIIRLDETLPAYGEWTPDVDGSWGPEVQWWPLEGWAGALATDLFSSQWETRHGAATALRDMLKSHGSGVGKERGTSAAQMLKMHQSWLEDIALRLLCVLALDKFGDFVTDQVVAPVRETCAQCLGIVASLMDHEGVKNIVSALSILTKQNNWEARHGAHLGLKYVIAVQQELNKEAYAFPSVVQGLWDPVDDVAAAAAAALLGGVKTLVRKLPHTLSAIIARVRQLLASQDELAAACGNYMALLAAILAEPDTNSILGPKYLASVVPRLWPYLSHPTSSVRRTALQTLRTLTLCPGLLFPTTNVKDVPKTEPIVSHTDRCNVNNDIEPSNGKEEGSNKFADTKDVLETKTKSNGLENSEEWVKLLYGNATDVDVDEACTWNSQLLQEVLRHVFQRVLIEHINDIQLVAEEVWNNLVKCSNLEMLLHAACPFVSPFMCLTMQPAKISFDPAMLISARPFSSERAFESIGANVHLPISQKCYVGGSETTPLSVREANVTRTRCIAARMLGLLSCYIVQPAPGIVYTPEMESPVNCYVKLLLVYLSSKSALQRMIVGLVVSSWAKKDKTVRPAPSDLVNKLHECLMQPVYYDEIAVTCTRILQESRDFIALMKHYKICQEDDALASIISLEQAVQFMGHHCQDLMNNSKIRKNKLMQSLEERRKNILSSALHCSNEQSALSLATLAALAGAVANLNALPEKLNPVIKPLMESIKKEENEHLQLVSADNLAEVLSMCVDRQPSPNPKVLNNLCTFLRSDTEFTPKVTCSLSNGDIASDDSGVENKNKPKGDNMYHGILTLSLQRRQAERAVFRRANSTASTSGASRGPGRPPASDIPLDELFPIEDDIQKQCRVQRRGATMAFLSLAKHFGPDLSTRLPKLWEIILAPLVGATININENEPFSQAEDIITNLQVLEVVAPAIDKTLLPELMKHFEGLTNLLENHYKAVRHMASRCFAVLASVDPQTVMQAVVDKIIPMLGTADSVRKRQGAAEALSCIVDKMQISVVPYIVFLIVPLLGRMSDQDVDVGLMSTHCFATLIQLMPLEGAIKEVVPLSDALVEQRVKDKRFLEQLFNPKSIGDYTIPVPIKAELRSYQQAGINWLAFLNRYKLHGVLCDDMGLGKTLQSICMVAGDHHYRQIKYKETKSPDCAPLPSLIICPPTLTGHWVYEVKKFMSSRYLNPLHYTGPPYERERLKNNVKNHNMVVASYDIVRKDIEFFKSIKWNYCILDEGHVIKNGKTKASKAIKTLVADHRIILSGTPIQNNVLELWSLFDFLMPGLLGTERQFTARYSRPILAARDPKATPQHQEAGVLAMESLHRQVLPFLLRRMKEDVLTELPPKITQDYYCELSPLQRRLYEDFSRAHMPNGLPEGKHHVFQALRYLQNVCNHPKLVLSPQHPEYSTVTQELAKMNSNLNDIQHSAKLTALKQLLQDCGIGCSSGETTGVLSQHRALVFCQLKVMLDVLEKDLLQSLLPNVSYLRLDGSVAPGQRQQLVQRFNNDPSIDILLLTTQVGGLGLNLTGADTVIFVEHDWNPMKDLQAMDRAHRIGQKKVVNVYRLITKSTLEEKIMGLQKFKLLTANTVISGENASLETMGTDQLLDLFHLDKKNTATNPGTSGQASGGTSVKTILESLPELWDDQQYENEYDMTQFIRSLKK